MKKILLLIVAIASVSMINAQKKVCIGILPFSSVEGHSELKYVNSIQDAVTNAFVKTQRFTIVDRSKIEALQFEKELQKTEDYIDGSVVKQGNAIGAQYLILGNVNAASVEHTDASLNTSRVSLSKTSYRAKLSLTLEVVDVSTGQVTKSETIEPKSGNALLGAIGIGGSTPEAAISGAIKNIEQKIDLFVDQNFPLTVTIAQISEKKKDEAKKILIAAGSTFGLKKGDKFKVVEVSVMQVNGKSLKHLEQLGELKVTKVDDENFSECDVKKGGKEICKEFTANPSKIQVITEL